MMVSEHNNELVDGLASLQPKTVDYIVLAVWDVLYDFLSVSTSMTLL